MTRRDNLPYSRLSHERHVLDAFLPDRPNGACLFFVHGGGWVGGERERWHEAMEHFCRLGYVCTTASYRFCPEVTLVGMLQDVRLAMSFVKQHSEAWGFDAQRVAAYGSSAGGHLVGMLATIRPEDDLGMTDEVAVRETVSQAVVAINPALSLSRLDQKWIPERMLPDWPAEAGSPSPEERLTGLEPPVIIAVGDIDDVAPLAMQEGAVAALRRAGVPVELVVVPGAGHGSFYGVTSDAQRIALPHIERFLQRVLGVR